MGVDVKGRVSAYRLRKKLGHVSAHGTIRATDKPKFDKLLQAATDERETYLKEQNNDPST